MADLLKTTITGDKDGNALEIKANNTNPSPILIVNSDGTINTDSGLKITVKETEVNIERGTTKILTIDSTGNITLNVGKVNGTNIKITGNSLDFNDKTVLTSDYIDDSPAWEETGKTASQKAINTELGTKEPKLTGDKLNAVNSGITNAKVNKYDGYEKNKQDTLTETQLNAVNSGITKSKVDAYDSYEEDKADKTGENSFSGRQTFKASINDTNTTVINGGSITVKNGDTENFEVDYSGNINFNGELKKNNEKIFSYSPDDGILTINY